MTASVEAAALVTLAIPAELVDEYSALAKLREEFAPTEGRYQKLRGKISELILEQNADPEMDYTVAGERWALEISPCAIDREVNVKRAKRKLGAARFLEVCSVTMKALEKFLLKHEIEELVDSDRTGARKYVPVPLQ